MTKSQLLLYASAYVANGLQAHEASTVLNNPVAQSPVPGKILGTCQYYELGCARCRCVAAWWRSVYLHLRLTSALFAFLLAVVPRHFCMDHMQSRAECCPCCTSTLLSACHVNQMVLYRMPCLFHGAWKTPALVQNESTHGPGGIAFDSGLVLSESSSSSTEALPIVIITAASARLRKGAAGCTTILTGK